MRDWPSTLFPASFRGVPFFVESDQEHGGRRLAIHQFPGSDTPFIEDLGQEVREFHVTAYLASDSSDSQSSGLVSILTASGAGVLVLPVQGSINARLHQFTRERSKDRMGYIGFTLTFIREGAATALISTLFRSQQVFDAVSALGIATTSAAARLQVIGQPGWVAESAAVLLQDIPATLEMIRAGAIIDPATSLTMQGTLSDIFNTIPDALSPLGGVDTSPVSNSIAAAIGLADAMGPAAAVPAFGAAIDIVFAPPPMSAATPAARISAANAALVQRLLRLTLITGYVEGLMQTKFANRPQGVAARSALVSRFETELSNSIGAANVDLNISLQNLRAKAIAYFSALIVDLRPIITVTSNEPMPALWWAWRLYQDPDQALAIVATNKIRHPAWLPTLFRTIAPSPAGRT